MSKAKAAIFWAGSCGGCDIATLDIHEFLIPLIDKIEFVFWPCAMDFKYEDVEKLANKSIDVTFFNGAIRNSENEHIAKLLREKTKIMVAFGSCAAFGGIPALSNLTTKKETFDRAYITTPSTDNKDKIMPQPHNKINGFELEIPEIYNDVLKLSDVIEVDYFMPGCPPVPKQVINVLTAILEGKLPIQGSVIGAGVKNVCEECQRTRKEKKIKKFLRPQEVENFDMTTCLLDQGVICLGPATREGCGAQCPTANIGCRGCYGAPEGVKDQGLKMLSALASVIDAKEEEEINAILETIPDPAGTFYRFTMSDSLLKRKAM